MHIWLYYSCFITKSSQYTILTQMTFVGWHVVKPELLIIRPQIYDIYFILSGKIGSDISCKLSPEKTICMKYQSLISGKNKENISNCHLIFLLPSICAGLGGSVGCPTGDQEVAASSPAWSATSFVEIWLWFKKGSCQFLAKECAQYWLTA